MKFIDSEKVAIFLDAAELIDRLYEAFKTFDTKVPMRHHHDYVIPGRERESTLLLMPAWVEGQMLGVKMVTVSPDNKVIDLPSIQGLYILNDAVTGTPRLIVDARELTAKRTAAASALASKFLSRTNSSSLVMVGTGTLAPHLIEAHSLVRPIKHVFIWGRDVEKARAVCRHPRLAHLNCRPVTSIESIISDVDIISCATLSREPLIFGKGLRNGQHVDLVGAYRSDMREADDEVMLRADIYVDTYQGALKETGDLVIPLEQGVISRQNIKGDLHQLCNRLVPGRTSDDTITCFKSVGHAMEDLVAATLLFEILNSSSDR